MTFPREFPYTYDVASIDRYDERDFAGLDHDAPGWADLYCEHDIDLGKPCGRCGR